MKYLALLTVAGTLLIGAWRADAQSTQMQQSSPMPSGAPAQSEPVATVTLSVAGKAGGPSAQAILSQKGPNVEVTVNAPNAATSNANVSIYRGACAASPSGKATHVLGKLSNGSLRATIPNTTVAQLAKSPDSIVIDQTPSLCGELSTVNPVPGTQETSGPEASPQPHRM